jgi:dephospho-CoA kinase
MIAVVAGPEERKEREIARARFGQNITEKSFLMRDAEELKIGIGSVIALADEYVDANQSMKSMLASMEKAYSRLVK